MRLVDIFREALDLGIRITKINTFDGLGSLDSEFKGKVGKRIRQDACQLEITGPCTVWGPSCAFDKCILSAIPVSLFLRQGFGRDDGDD